MQCGVGGRSVVRRVTSVIKMSSVYVHGEAHRGGREGWSLETFCRFGSCGFMSRIFKLVLYPVVSVRDDRELLPPLSSLGTCLFCRRASAPAPSQGRSTLELLISAEEDFGQPVALTPGDQQPGQTVSNSARLWHLSAFQITSSQSPALGRWLSLDRFETDSSFPG